MHFGFPVVLLSYGQYGQCWFSSLLHVHYFEVKEMCSHLQGHSSSYRMHLHTAGCSSFLQFGCVMTISPTFVTDPWHKNLVQAYTAPVNNHLILSSSLRKLLPFVCLRLGLISVNSDISIPGKQWKYWVQSSEKNPFSSHFVSLRIKINFQSKPQCKWT